MHERGSWRCTPADTQGMTPAGRDPGAGHVTAEVEHPEASDLAEALAFRSGDMGVVEGGTAPWGVDRPAPV